MANLETRTALKAIFQTGDELNQAAFVSLIDTLAMLDEVQTNTSVSRTTYHTPSTTAVLNGQTIDSGQTPTVTGVGYLTTVSNSAGYIHDPTNSNTYIFVNSGSRITRVKQRFSGTQAVIAIGLAASAADIVHVEFPTSSTAVCTLFITGVGTGLQMAVARATNSIPNINDGVPHDLVVEIIGDYVTAYVDGVQVGAWYDPRTSTVAGNWYYSQITATTANCKIWGFESFNEQPQSYSIDCGLVKAGVFQSQVFHVGSPAVAAFDPDSPVYIHLNYGEVFHVEGTSGMEMLVESLSEGNNARLRLKNSYANELILACNGAATATLSFQETTYISIANSGRLTFPYPLSGSTVANATDASSVIARLNELLSILRTVGVIST